MAPKLKGSRLLRLFADDTDDGRRLMPRAASSGHGNTALVPSKVSHWARQVIARQRAVESDKGLNDHGRTTQRAAEAIAARQGLDKLRLALLGDGDHDPYGCRRHATTAGNRWREASNRKVAGASVFEMTAAAVLLGELAKVDRKQLPALVDRAQAAGDAVTLRALADAPVLLDVPQQVREAAQEALHVVAAPQERAAFDAAQAALDELESTFDQLAEDLAGIANGTRVLDGEIDHRAILDGRRRNAVRQELNIVDDEPTTDDNDAGEDAEPAPESDDLTPAARVQRARATAS